MGIFRLLFLIFIIYVVVKIFRFIFSVKHHFESTYIHRENQKKEGEVTLKVPKNIVNKKKKNQPDMDEFDQINEWEQAQEIEDADIIEN